MKSKIPMEEKIETAKQYIKEENQEVISFLRGQFYENKLLGGSLSKYSSFEEYIACELIELDSEQKD